MSRAAGLGLLLVLGAFPVPTRGNHFTNPNPGWVNIGGGGEPLVGGADICVLMDVSGSMGSWVNTAKTALFTAVENAKNAHGLSELRVSFIGYRDWADGRSMMRSCRGSEGALGND